MIDFVNEFFGFCIALKAVIIFCQLGYNNYVAGNVASASLTKLDIPRGYTSENMIDDADALSIIIGLKAIYYYESLLLH